MLRLFRRAIDAIYVACAVISGMSLVVISVVIPWGVFARYVLNHAESWPEPMSILLTIVLTFFGAPACYRIGMHMRVGVIVDNLPKPMRRAADFLAEALVGALGIFMVIWGAGLCETTWHQGIDEFPSLSAGVTYLPIPIGGAITFLFVLERMLLGRPALPSEVHADADASVVAADPAAQVSR